MFGNTSSTLLFCDAATPFVEHQRPVGLTSRKYFLATILPKDFDAVNAGSGAKTEVSARFTAAKIAFSWVQPGLSNTIADSNLDFRSISVSFEDGIEGTYS